MEFFRLQKKGRILQLVRPTPKLGTITPPICQALLGSRLAIQVSNHRLITLYFNNFHQHRMNLGILFMEHKIPWTPFDLAWLRHAYFSEQLHHNRLRGIFAPSQITRRQTSISYKKFSKS